MSKLASIWARNPQIEMEPILIQGLVLAERTLIWEHIKKNRLVGGLSCFIEAIKLIRRRTNCDLRDAKDLADNYRRIVEATLVLV